MDDRPIVVITSRGHKSGKLRKNPVMRVEHEGVYAAIASKGGAPAHPEWFHNFTADPHVDRQDGPDPHPYAAPHATAQARAAWWQPAVAPFPPSAAARGKAAPPEQRPGG